MPPVSTHTAWWRYPGLPGRELQHRALGAFRANIGVRLLRCLFHRRPSRGVEHADGCIETQCHSQLV
jgi:hypothetical protein